MLAHVGRYYPTKPGNKTSKIHHKSRKDEKRKQKWKFSSLYLPYLPLVLVKLNCCHANGIGELITFPVDHITMYIMNSGDC